MSTQQQDPVASAPTLKTANRVVLVAPARMGAAAALSATLPITLASALRHSGATTVNTTLPPTTPPLPPA